MKSIILILLAIFSFSAFSHGGHSHGKKRPMGKLVAEKRIPDMARAHIANYIKKKALDKTWSEATHESTVKQEYKGKKEWISKFKNSKVANKDKQLLEVYMRVDGHLVGIKFSEKK